MRPDDEAIMAQRMPPPPPTVPMSWNFSGWMPQPSAAMTSAMDPHSTVLNYSPLVSDLGLGSGAMTAPPASAPMFLPDMPPHRSAASQTPEPPLLSGPSTAATTPTRAISLTPGRSSVTSDSGAAADGVHQCLHDGDHGPCGIVFSSEAELQQHCVKVHIPKEKPDGGYVCRWSGCRRPGPFGQRSKLQRHFMTHTCC